jgi:hypothetical protein
MNLTAICTQPVTTRPIRVNPYEFPLSIDDHRRPAMSAGADPIRATCSLSAAQPDRSFYLGSWISGAAAQERTT